MINLYYELMRKVKGHGGKKYLMIGDYVPGKVLCEINEVIGIKKMMILK